MSNAPTGLQAPPAAPASRVFPVKAAVTAPTPLSATRTLANRASADAVRYLSHRMQYVGRVGVVGIALLIFAIAFFVSTNSALRTMSSNLRTDLATAQQDAAARRSSGLDVSPTATSLLFISKLPARGELPKITERIVQQAAVAGLVLERGSYDFTVTHSGQIVRARLSFPVQGAYPAIRSFVDGTLAAIPNVAVDGLSLERKNIGSAEIDADIRFAVFLRNAS